MMRFSEAMPTATLPQETGERAGGQLIPQFPHVPVDLRGALLPQLMGGLVDGGVLPRVPTVNQRETAPSVAGLPYADTIVSRRRTSGAGTFATSSEVEGVIMSDDERVDEASEESLPASDPPAGWAGENPEDLNPPEAPGG
jgi:hypothetical protein